MGSRGVEGWPIGGADEESVSGAVRRGAVGNPGRCFCGPQESHGDGSGLSVGQGCWFTAADGEGRQCFGAQSTGGMPPPLPVRKHPPKRKHLRGVLKAVTCPKRVLARGGGPTRRSVAKTLPRSSDSDEEPRRYAALARPAIWCPRPWPRDGFRVMEPMAGSRGGRIRHLWRQGGESIAHSSLPCITLHDNFLTFRFEKDWAPPPSAPDLNQSHRPVNFLNDPLGPVRTKF